jgi:lipopolysaccharide export LptBFGC system permease protein LptF
MPFRILDNYVTRIFLYTYLICLATVIGLYIIVDAFATIDEVIEAYGLKGLIPTLARVYLYKLPLIYYQVGFVITVMAGMFTVTRLSKYNEILAMKAAGVSVYRILWPVFILAIGITALIFVDQEMVIPALAEAIDEAQLTLRGEKKETLTSIFKSDSFGNIFIAEKFIAEESRLEGVSIVQLYPDGSQKIYITADYGLWKEDDQGIKRWHLYEGEEYHYNRAQERIHGTPWPLNPESSPIKLKDEKVDPDDFLIQSDLKPEDLFTKEVRLGLLSTAELRARSEELPNVSFLKALVYERYTFPLTNLILLMLGLPLVLREEHKSAFLSAGLCILLCVAFYGIYFACSQLSRKGMLSHIEAAWLPVLLFGALGLYLFDGVKS